MSTIILKVDLECRSCYKKISKTICKLQEKENIQSIAFDEKNNTVTISGPFDSKMMCKKLCTKACKVIKDIQIKGDKPKDAKPAESKGDKPKDAKPAESKGDKPAEAKKDKPKDDKPAEAKKDKTKDDKPKDDKPAEPKKEKPKEDKPAEPKDKASAYEFSPPGWSEPVYMVEPPKYGYQPAWTGHNQGYYGGNSGGYGYGWAPSGPPPVVYGAPVYGAPVYETGAPVYGGYKSNEQFFSEESPQDSCSIM